jgi:hypothetical protein
MLTHSFDSVSTAKTLSCFDSITIHQTKIIGSLNALNTTADKLLNQHKFFGVISYDTIFTVVVTLLTFSAGIIIDRIIKHLDSRSKKIKLQHYFKYLLDVIADKTFTKISDGYKITYETTDLDKGIAITPPKVLTDIFQRVKSINEQELLDTFKTREPVSQIINHVEFISKMFDEIEKFHIKVLYESDTIRKTFEGNLSKYFKLLAQYLEDMKKIKSPTPAITEFFPIAQKGFKIYHEEILETNQMKKLRDEVIRPIQVGLAKNKLYQEDAIAGQIAELGKEISIKFYYLNKLTADFCSQYKDFYQTALDSQKIIKDERAKILWMKPLFIK